MQLYNLFFKHSGDAVLVRIVWGLEIRLFELRGRHCKYIIAGILENKSA